MISAFLLVAFGRHQQAADSTPQPHILLEVIAADYQLFSSVKYVYLRIFPDGTVEYHDPLHIDLFDPSTIRRTLSSEQMNQLKAGLSEPEVGKLSGEYYGGGGVDTSLRWDVTFETADKTYRFTLWNFTYDLRRRPKDREIPEPARKLGCMLEEINDNLRSLDRHSEQCVKPVGAAR
jgi:hypothetical protein